MKKNGQFDFKQKTDLHIKNFGLNMINGDPYIENKTGTLSMQEKRIEKGNEKNIGQSKIEKVSDKISEEKEFEVESVNA